MPGSSADRRNQGLGSNYQDDKAIYGIEETVQAKPPTKKERTKDDAAFPIPVPITTPKVEPARFGPGGTPFWKTDGFKDFVKKIESGTIPTSDAPSRSSVGNGNFTLAAPIAPKKNLSIRPGFDNEAQIRADVIKNMSYVPPGATPKQVNDYVDKQVKERLAVVTGPRTTFLSNGTPVYLDREDERIAYAHSIQSKSPLERAWLQIKFDVPYNLTKIISAVGQPAVRTKEFFTDTTDKSNAIGSAAQSLLNAGLYGVELLRNGVESAGLVEYQNEKDQAERSLNLAISHNDPAGIEAAQTRIAEADSNLQAAVSDYRNQQLRNKTALLAVENSWAQLNGVRTNYQEWLDKHGLKNEGGRFANPQYYEDLIKDQEIAQVEADDFRNKAKEAFINGNYEEAIQMTQSAQEADRRASSGDPYGAYTWIREPDKYNDFLQDTALVELQKGSPLTAEEIRRIKEYHVNGWTEITGEGIFDPINLIPAAVLEQVIKVPFKALGTVGRAVGETFPGVVKAVDVLGSPVKWIMRESIQSGANRIMNSVYSAFSRITADYVTAEDMVRALDQVSETVVAARAATTEDGAKAIFEAARPQMKGLQNITFGDFRQLMDAAEHIPAEEGAWGKLFSNALQSSEDYLRDVAVKAGRTIEDNADLVVPASRRAGMEFSGNFFAAYTDAHRIFKGSAFLDDTVAGWVSKTLRELSGSQINEALKLSGFDQFVLKYGETLAPKTKSLFVGADRAVEGILHVASNIRDVWSGMVLSTYRWVITNMLDTGFRDVIHGGNFMDDIRTLFMSTQRHFADDLGFVDMRLMQNLQMDLDVAHSVPMKLLYEDFRPKAGPFTYWAEAYKQELTTDATLAKRNILNKLLDEVPDGKLKNAMSWLGDGMYVKTPTVVKTWARGIQDFNSSIEFTFRLRMFHREYFKLLETLEPRFLEKGLENLSPAVREIAKQVWDLSDGSPSRLTSYVDSIVGNKAAKGIDASLSLIVPNDIKELTRGMDTANRQLFISQVRGSLEELVKRSAEKGQRVTAEEFSKFMDDYGTMMKDEYQHHISQIYDKRFIDTTIGKDGVAVEMPTIDDLKGSAPRRIEELDRNKIIEDATKNLKRGKNWQKPEEVINNFSTAISEHADVQRVPGGGITVVTRGKRPVIQIGNEIKNVKSVYGQMNAAVQEVLIQKDLDVILRGGFESAEEFKDVMRNFIDDPAKLLSTNEKQFVTLTDRLTTNPQLRDLLDRTGTKKFNYDSLLDVYRNFGTYTDAYGFSRSAEEVLQEIADAKVKVPTSHVTAAQTERMSTTNMARLRYDAEALPAPVRDKIGQYLESWDAYRKNLRQFWTFSYPGPKTLRGEERQAAWKMFYDLGADAYNKEATIKDGLVELFKADPQAAEKTLDEAMTNFPDYFLKQNGINITWDPDTQKILNVEIKNPINGKRINMASELDRKFIDERFFAFDAKRSIKENKLLRLDLEGKPTLHRQLTISLRDTFAMPTERSNAWATVIENHAKKWAETTGQDIEQYYQRLGFVKTESGYGLASDKSFRMVKRGAIQRTEEGKFIFYGLGQSNFESLVRETGELFYDDFISMAEHSDASSADLKALNEVIEKMTGEPVRANVLNKKQADAFQTLFTNYVATGMGPDIKLKRSFEKFKGWLADTFEGIQGTPIADDLAADVNRRLNGMFIESKMKVVPTSNSRSIQLMASEAGLEFEDETNLLNHINSHLEAPVQLPAPLQAERQKLLDEVQKLDRQAAQAREDIATAAAEGDDRLYNQVMNQGQMQIRSIEDARTTASEALAKFDQTNAASAHKIMPPEMHTQWEEWKNARAGTAEFPPQALESPDAFRQHVLLDRLNKDLESVDAEMAVIFSDPGITPEIKQSLELRIATQKMDMVKEYNKMLEGLEKFDVMAPKAYTKLSDVPREVAARALGSVDNPLDAQVTKEISEAWDTWKTSKDLRGFPKEAMTSPDTFKTYLQNQIDNNWSEAGWQYNKILADVEHFENAVMDWHFGDTFATRLEPKVPEAMLSQGMKTFVRNSTEMLNDMETALRSLESWKGHLTNLAEGVNPLDALTTAQRGELTQWGLQAAVNKSEMLNILTNGGKVGSQDIEGAINTVNRFMIDYQHKNVFDQFMKNIFPFWTFPSRSLPFWTQTMATHPQLIAAYEKIQRLSRTQRYQSGAVTSQGKPSPSLDGYIKIPGSDMWFNPLAPFSFRYLLDVSKNLDNVEYAARSAEEGLDPQAYLAREFTENSQLFGFSPAPWIGYLMKQAFNLPDDSMPKFPLAPQISLMPRWMVQDMIHKANKINVMGMDGWGDAIYPEVTWHDYLVEQRIYQDAVMKLRTGNLTNAQRDALRVDIINTIKYKNTPLWNDTYKDVTSDEAVRAAGSFFTGIYAKPFSEGQAALYQIRNERNLAISAMNNEFQTEVFKLPDDAATSYQNYIDHSKTDEGWLYRLYTDSGFVKDDSGKLVTDPAERAKWLAISIEQEQKQADYYAQSTQVMKEYNQRLRAMPVGSSYSQLAPIYDWYADRMNALDYLRVPKGTMQTNKPQELIEQGLKRDWYQSIMRYKPQWDAANGETYDKYKERVAEWQNNLPNLAPKFMAAFVRKKNNVDLMNALKPDQRLDPSFFQQLAEETGAGGIANFEKENDDIFDAMNNAFQEIYWQPYWASGVMDKGYHGDLAQHDFLAQHPTPPTGDQLFAWIQQRYGDRFTVEEVRKYADEAGVETIQQKQLEGKPEDAKTRQEIWDMLSYIGPGSANRAAFESTFAELGGDLTSLETWKDEGGHAYTTQPEKLQKLYEDIRAASQAMQLSAPPRAELVRYVQAQDQNDQFQELIKTELGDKFYDLLGFYSQKSKEDKAKFRSEQPQLYETIQSYYNFKDQYAADHSVWNDYYGSGVAPTTGTAPDLAPVHYTGSSFTPRQSKTNFGAGRGGVPLPRKPNKPSTYYKSKDKTPYFGIVNNGGTNLGSLPPAFLKAAGSNLTWEIMQAYNNKRPISNSGQSYLRSLQSRHPEWNTYIEGILST